MNSDALNDKKIPNAKEIALSSEFLTVRANLIIVGLDLATEIKRNVKTLIYLYHNCNK